MCQPADPRALAVALGELSSWVEDFGIVALPEDAEERRAKLTRICARYAEHLSDMPSDLVVAAVRATVRTHRFRNLPLPGDIRAIAAAELANRAVLCNRLRSVLRVGRFAAAPVAAADRVRPDQLAELRRRIAASGIRRLPGADTPEVGEAPPPAGPDARRDRYADR